ncbi:MAG: alpha/beta hydrolase [Solirubrobacterales bacterium]
MADAESARFEVEPAPVLRGEAAGEGPAVVLCHGLTATRRYVVHGSRALERAGHLVVSYDARGHGESDPAPAGEGYVYPRQVDDLERVVGAQLPPGRRFLLAGNSMGAHTAVAYALRHPERLAGLVLIGPSFTGAIEPESLAEWERLAAALETGGVDGFVARIGETQPDSPWRDSVLRFTRERMLRHQDLAAVTRALREVPASRPFDSLEQLRSLRVPTLVVASHDEADPGHPYETAVAYAEALPLAQLVSEGEGESPLAWQGGRLSRHIDAFYAEALSSSL